MAKVEDYGNGVYVFWCPACQEHHPYNVPRWSFNGDVEKPTFEPSLRIYAKHLTEKVTACHLCVTNGQIRYCGDCPHEFAGKTIDMVDMPV